MGTIVGTPERIVSSTSLKSGLYETIVTALDKEFEAFKYLQEFFPKFSAVKVKAGISVGP